MSSAGLAAKPEGAGRVAMTGTAEARWAGGGWRGGGWRGGGYYRGYGGYGVGLGLASGLALGGAYGYYGAPYYGGDCWFGTVCTLISGDAASFALFESAAERNKGLAP